MAITMQGTWTVSVKSKEAAWPQRFVIAGADAGNGMYAGEVATPPVNVSGDLWTITIQHNPPGPQGWTASAERLTTPAIVAGQIRVDIESDDSAADRDYDDLVLTCATAASVSEYVVYGRVRSYAGFCRFNPCFPFPWIVIDSPAYLVELLNFPSVRTVLESLYPDRIRPFLERPGLIRPPRPEPDPAPFVPLMIPMGEPAQEPAASAAARRARAGQAAAGMAMAQRSARLAIGSAVLRDVAPYALDIARLVDLFHPSCTVTPQPGLLLRFLEYDRTATELAGGPYTGTGTRELLGHTATDDQGGYLFRFSWTLTDIAAEAGDIVAGGPPVATQLQPDLIVQVVSGGAAGVLYESGLYADVPNLRRIDLCIPDNVLNPGPTACQGGRAIQSIGNIWTIAGVGNTLDADGRITATNPAGPIITRGAWVGRLDFFACFLDHPSVKYYTIRFRRPGGSWTPVQEEYRHIKIADIGLPNYLGTRVGPDVRNLAVGGGPKVNVPSYLNIESDPEWLATHRLRKIQLTSVLYETALYGPGESPRSVELRIEGYTAAGDKVAGADDTIRLLIDNRGIDGDIASVAMGAVSPGECALFELASPNAPLTVRFKVHHPGGFVQSYLLDVIRGSNTGVPVSDTTAPVQPLNPSYNEPTHGNFFFGTLNAVSPDGAGYVVAELQPNSGAWLPPATNFCAFAFRLSATPRTTNGYGLSGGSYLDFELVGISYTPPGP